ncbi:3-5 exonuclease domain [Pyrenophora tritici-repentis]|nr:3-5 exonuclease domain [Pyrenophora tritici-repentis]
MAAPQETPIAPRMAFISTTDDLADMLGTLADLPTSPPSLYIDLEGNSLSRAGTLSLLTLYVCPQNIVYLVDVHGLQTTAFSTPTNESRRQMPLTSELDTVKPQSKLSDCDSGEPQLTNSNLDIEAAQSAPAGLGTAAAPVTLKTILESPTIPKVFFDVRNDSDALFTHYKVALSCIHDLQVMELATRPMTTGNSRQFLCSLSTCIRDNAPLSSTDLAAWTAIKEAGNALFDPKKGGSYSVFETRPLRTEVQDYCVQDVVYMPLLWDIFEHRIQKDRMDEAELAQMAEEYEKDKKKMGFWETMVKEAVVLRISVTWETWYRPNGVHKRKGCWTWGQIREARRRWALGFRHGLCD